MRKLFELSENFKIKLANYESEFFGEPLEGYPKDTRPEKDVNKSYNRIVETPEGVESTTQLDSDEKALLIFLLNRYKHLLPFESQRKHYNRFRELVKKLSQS